MTIQEKLEITQKEIRDFLPELRQYKRVLVELPIKLNDVLRFLQGNIKFYSNVYIDSLGDIVIFDENGDFIETNVRWDLDENHLCNQKDTVIEFMYSKTKHCTM
ncbi:hypothetical protein HZP82_15750 [Elizabethkingia anophelis]|nr:hypothetical protein [Elizabethkingia anophelis]MCT4106463.1 hypothetical protein [Elizabethkingia anophelis]